MQGEMTVDTKQKHAEQQKGQGSESGSQDRDANQEQRSV
jgi:hypothetical protein